MGKFTKVILGTTIVIFMAIIVSQKPLFSHTGHDHSRQIEPTQKTSEEQNKINQDAENTEKFSPNNHQMSQETQTSTKKLNSDHIEKSIYTTSQISTPKFNFIPQPTELVFLLLLASPLLLYTIKNKMYNNE